MTDLTPGANLTLPAAATYAATLTTSAAHADLIVLCVRADGTADGDNGVALWSQPQCAGGAVRIDTARNEVTVDTRALPADIERLLIVGQADGVADFSGVGRVSAAVRADAAAVTTLRIDTPPAMPTVQIAELYRRAGQWKVRCLGDGYADGLQRLLEVHGIQVTDGGDATPASAPAAPQAPMAPPPAPTFGAPPAAPAMPSAPAAPSAPTVPSAPTFGAPSFGGQPPAQAPAFGAPSQYGAPGPNAPAGAPIDLEKQRRVDILKKVQATGSVSLVKKVEAAAVSLEKTGLVGQRAQVVLVLDVSGSARPLFRDGRYQVLIERALAAGLLFDDDGTIQAYLFDTRLHEAPDITLGNISTWAQQVQATPGIWGGTNYAPPIERIAHDVGRGQAVPTYAMFITDGGNFDRRETTQAMKMAAGMSVFWQFMAVGREQDFPFLQKLDDLKGREVDNADFFAVMDPAAVPDEVFFGQMMQEFPGWIAEARRRGILR